MKFIDISKWNGIFDWQKSVNQGVEGAWLKASGSGPYGNYEDNRFKENSESCPLPYKGAYHYFDYTGRSGKDQCKFFLDTCDGFNNLRGVLDLEDNSGNGWPKLSSMYGAALREALAFVQQYMLETGHFPVMYLNTGLTILQDTWGRYTFRNFLECPLWVARYADVPDPLVSGTKHAAWPDYGAWQYTSKENGYLYGNAPGNDFIDMNIVKDLKSLLVPGETGSGNTGEVVTDSQKLEKLWVAHPELH
jgi:GH25 family lysozyme M1 (1,4-beta-N-acetylmuramidase)